MLAPISTLRQLNYKLEYIIHEPVQDFRNSSHILPTDVSLITTEKKL